MTPDSEASSLTTDLSALAASFLKTEGVRGIVRLAYHGYLRYQVSRANFCAEDAYNCTFDLIDTSESAVWGALLYREFLACGDEEDLNVGPGSILPVRALMAARMANGQTDPMAIAKEILDGTPIEHRVLDTLGSRWTLKSVVSFTTTQEAATVVYTASALELCCKNHDYLSQLAEALRLPAKLVAGIEHEILRELTP